MVADLSELSRMSDDDTELIAMDDEQALTIGGLINGAVE